MVTTKERLENNPYSGDAWIPIRNGIYYCSKACGGRCKIVDFDRAGILARKLVDLLGEGWEPHVHENLGWHYAAIHTASGLRLSEFRHPRPLESPVCSWNVTTGTMITGNSQKSPQDAVASVVAQFQAEAERWSARYESVKNLVEVAV